MKSIIFSALFILIGWNAHAQNVDLKVTTGDSELDVALTDLNTSAESAYAAFKTDMKTTYNVTGAKLDELKTTYEMQASDIFMTLELSKTSGKTVDDVAAEFKKSKGKGWGVIAQNLGVKPGSAEFKALKGNAKTKNEKLKGKEKSKTTTGKVNKTAGASSKSKSKVKTK